jgi:hypothetical protein
LIRQALSGHIADEIGARGIAMDGKARIILVTTMTAIMVLMVTLVATFINLGLAHDFLVQWAKAYFVSWPIAAITGYLVMPMARRFTARVMALLDGTA